MMICLILTPTAPDNILPARVTFFKGSLLILLSRDHISREEKRLPRHRTIRPPPFPCFCDLASLYLSLGYLVVSAFRRVDYVQLFSVRAGCAHGGLDRAVQEAGLSELRLGVEIESSFVSHGLRWL